MAKKSKFPLSVHFQELKLRLGLSLLFFILGFCLCYSSASQIYDFLIKPLAILTPEGQGKKMIFTGLAEAFFTRIKISCFTGFLISFPLIAIQFYAFLAPALYKDEKRVVLPYLIFAPVLFLAGAFLAYYFVIPLAWEFFLSFENIEGIHGIPLVLEARISEYLSLVMSLIIGFGIAFQLPIALTLLARVGLLSGASLAAKRKYAVVGIFIAAAALTPPDVISQIALAIPLLLLYEISVVICSRIQK